MEQRHDTRKAINMEVAIHCPWGIVGGRAMNLSRRGMFVELRQSLLEIDSSVEVTPVLSGQKPGALRLPARVARATASGVGLMFQNDAQERARLWAIAADPAPSSQGRQDARTRSTGG